MHLFGHASAASSVGQKKIVNFEREMSTRSEKHCFAKAYIGSGLAVVQVSHLPEQNMLLN